MLVVEVQGFSDSCLSAGSQGKLRLTSVVLVVGSFLVTFSHLSNCGCLPPRLIPPDPYTTFLVLHQSMQSVVQRQRSMTSLVKSRGGYDQREIGRKRDQQVDLG